MLIGGGSGGHITPLLAVAHELKKIDPNIELLGVCETNSKFASLYDDKTIKEVFQIPAGKYRRYGSHTLLQKLTDINTIALNFRDIFKTLNGYRKAIRLLKAQKPDALLIKGGFVAVPMGLAAAKLKIPFVTHDSDSTPGLANRIVSRWATYNACGMPADLYSYPKTKLVFTGTPLSENFKKVDNVSRSKYRQELGLGNCSLVISVVGGSLGGGQLNKDFASICRSLMDLNEGLGVIHVAGDGKNEETLSIYKKNLTEEQLKRVVLTGFVNDIYKRQAAADIVITRAGATQVAELAVQGIPIVIVPADLAGGHQDINADYYVSKGIGIKVESGDQEALESEVTKLLTDNQARKELSLNLLKFSKPEAAKELAELIVRVGSDK